MKNIAIVLQSLSDGGAERVGSILAIICMNMNIMSLSCWLIMISENTIFIRELKRL